MATRKKLSEAHSQVKALNPKDPDTKYMGEEPLFLNQPESQTRKISIARALNWYNRFYGRKDAKELVCQYLELSNRDKEAKIVRKVNESEITNSYAWLSRMKLRGLQLTENENLIVEDHIKKLIKSIDNPDLRVSQTSIQKVKIEIVNNKPNVQEIMRDKAREAAGEIEGMLDDLLTTGKANGKVIDTLSRVNVLPQHIPMIVNVWKRKQAEFDELQLGKDKDLTEAYKHLGKIQIRNITKFIEQVLGDLNSYISVKKANKTPRKRKAVPVEKIVAKLKFLKEFKDAVNKIDLVSVHPTKLHGSSEAWVYDAGKRKLHHYIADDYSKVFTIKGNTLLGFDANKSEIKTLRKPGEQIKEIMGSKPAARKYFDNIKAVSSKPNGRFNENMIILKAF